jgi:CheY-like chemotaxis protein
MSEKAFLLMVDNNPGDQELVAVALRDLGSPLAMRAAMDGDEAVRQLDAMNDDELEACQAVLLDLNMPRMDGRAVLRWLKGKRRYRGIPVIVLTSSAIPGDRAECLAMGAADFWLKPSSFDEYVALVGRLPARH